MGGDGGSIPRRCEMVKLKKGKEQKGDPSQTAAARWRTCALSLRTLQAPVVACELGNLYNKDAVIEFVLDKDKINHTDSFAFSHIRKLKDVIPVTLFWSGDEKRTSADHVDDIRHVFICPITRVAANGRYPFVLMRNCGCVFAKRALDEMGDGDGAAACLNCSTPLRGMLVDEVLTVNPGTLEEVDVMRQRMQMRRLAKKKKNKKTKESDDSKQSRKRKMSAPQGGPHVTKKRPSSSINTQFQVPLHTIQGSSNQAIQKMWLSEAEQARVPLLTSTKIPTSTNIL